MKTIHTLLTILALTSAASAQIDVAIVAAASASSTDCRFTDPQTKLMATGMFSSVDIIHVGTATPTLAELQAYDACICWTNTTPADNDAWGDVMADYVDAGGGVVVTVYALTSTSGTRHLGGRWETGGYEVVVSQGGTSSGIQSLGTVHDPLHPVMAGVTTLDGGSGSRRPTTTALTPGSTLIAEWTDGKTLVAQGLNPRRVDLGMYPPSADCYTTGWESSTDGALLMANALSFVAGVGGEPGTSYCPGDGLGTLCPCGNNNNGSMGGCDWGNPAFPDGGVLSAIGSDSMADDDAYLVATGIEDNFGIFFGAANQVNSGNGNPLNDGLRCAGGALVRLIPPTMASGNQATTPMSVQTLDTGAAAGVTRRYQYWFRTPGGPCGQMANLTNGYEIVWLP